MTEERMAKAEIVRTALDQLARTLHQAGIPADIIVPSILGWAVGNAIHVEDPSVVADTLRRSADTVDGFAMPVSGTA